MSRAVLVGRTSAPLGDDDGTCRDGKEEGGSIPQDDNDDNLHGIYPSTTTGSPTGSVFVRVRTAVMEVCTLGCSQKPSSCVVSDSVGIFGFAVPSVLVNSLAARWMSPDHLLSSTASIIPFARQG